MISIQNRSSHHGGPERLNWHESDALNKRLLQATSPLRWIRVTNNKYIYL